MGREATLAREDGTTLCERCLLADTPLRRLKGLIGYAGIAAGQCMLVTPAPAVHTWFMRFPIDAVFVDRELRVVGVAAELRPWRFARRAGARAVVELAAGEAARHELRIGERLRWASGAG